MSDYKLLCIYAFSILESVLKNTSDLPEFPAQFQGQSYPIFVTWQIGPEKELRGCIGTFTPAPLEKNLKSYSLIAAFKDSRFPPIELKELEHLHVCVSLLTNFEDAKDPFDWEVGKHGIDIDFNVKNKDYSATFLPEVAEEEGWDQKTTLVYLVQKAGFRGKLEEALKNMKVKRYQSIKTNMSYKEYKGI